ncbi:MAG: hypothetical protein D3915_03740 [Candidatus Electrothrix sp. AU1_5]|nr:hypothetical protein [Candidatus Electrothrix gigas]
MIRSDCRECECIFEGVAGNYSMVFVETDEAGISNALKMMLCFILSLLLAITTTVIPLDI